MHTWYHLEHPEQIDSPSLLVFPYRVKHNIQKMIERAGDIERLRPHVKTHKMAEIARMHVDMGIHKFKCATPAEEEMLALNGASSILLAHQPVGPKLDRLVSMAAHFSGIEWACIVDDQTIVSRLQTACAASHVKLTVWLDLDNGMHRSGIEAGPDALAICKAIHAASNLKFGGIHAYDGHFREDDFSARKSASDSAFSTVLQFKQTLEAAGIAVPEIVAGGSPTFPVHALRSQVSLSPGTYVFWDAGYGSKFQDMDFLPAALVATRVISKPGPDRICIDLGHKSISGENPIDKRVRLLDYPNAEFLGHSEEHLVIRIPNRDQLEVEDLLLGVPWHVCPTVALHQQAYVIEEGKVTGTWKVIARDRILQF